MQALISPAQAAQRIGVSHATIRGWMRRAVNPLPSVIVGSSGRNRKVIVAEIDAWLANEATSKSVVSVGDGDRL